MPIDKRLGLFVVLAALFVTALVVGDLIGVKLFEVRWIGVPVTLSAGMLAFPLTFVITDLLNEFYGKRAARFVTLVGLGMAVFALLVIYAAVRVPWAPLTAAPDWAGVTAKAFDSVFAGSQRILAASLTAYVIGQFLDITIFQTLKRLSRNRLLWLRATGSTLVSQLLDTLVVQTLAWAGLLTVSQILDLVTTSYAVKILVAVALTPVIYLGHAIMERWLGITPLRLDERGNPLGDAGGKAA